MKLTLIILGMRYDDDDNDDATSTSIIDEHSNIDHEISNNVNGGQSAETWSNFSLYSNWIQDDCWPKISNQLKASKASYNEQNTDVEFMTSAGDNWGRDDLRNIRHLSVKTLHEDDDISLESWSALTVFAS